jgi:hypothetical protein
MNAFPLADFGNRVPSFRAEVSTGSSLSYVKDLFAGAGLVAPNPSGGTYTPVPALSAVDSLNRYGYIFNGSAPGGDNAQVVQKIALDVTVGNPADPFAFLTVYTKGDQVLDINGNIQLCIRSYTSSGIEPAWQTGEMDLTVISGQNTWQCLGPGPDLIPIVATHIFTPFPTSTDQFNMFAKETLRVDTGGYLWGQVASTSGGGATVYLEKYSPLTFACIGKVDITAYVGGEPSIAFIKSTRNSTNYIYYTNHNGGSTASVVVINADSCTILATGTLENTSTTFNGDAGGYFPTVDPNTGTMYILGHDTTATPFQTYVAVIETTSGILSPVYIPLSTALQNGNQVGKFAFWDAADNTLMVIMSPGNNTSGFDDIWKVDTDGTVLANTTGGVLDSNEQLNVLAYNGQVPTDGVLKYYSADNNIYYIHALDLTNTVVDVSNWFPAGVPGFAALAYDALSNSFLGVCGGASSYNGFSSRVYLDRQQVSQAALSAVITDLWTKAGGDTSLLNLSLIDGIEVRGFPVTQNSQPKSLLTPLCCAYFFDIVESDNLLTAVPRGQAVSTVIPESDLGLKSDGFELQPTVLQENDLPKTMTVLYYDPAQNYQQSKQMMRRNVGVVKSKNQTVISLPLTLEADEAAQIVAKALATTWAERFQFATKLWRASYLVVDPTDVVQFTYQNRVYVARVTKATVGQNMVMDAQMVSEDSRQYAQGQVTGNIISGFQPGSIAGVGPTILFMLDIPLLQDTDNNAPGTTGYYFAMSGAVGDWPGGVILSSADNQTFTPVAADTTPCTFGTTQLALGTPRTLFTWDYVNSITVNLQQGGGTLGSATLVEVLNGANWAYLSNGEVFAFSNAVLNADGSYTLSTLLRGLRGTEQQCGTHGPNETFILLTTSTTMRQTTATGFIGALQYFRGVTIGAPATAATSQQLTLQGNDLKPYAPAQLTGTVDGSSNINMTWVRRTRIGGAWLDGTGTVPLSEESESYDLAIYDGSGNLKRMVTGLTSPLYQYTAANQTTDFGSHQASVHITVWQNSATVGHGFPTSNPAVGNGSVVSG